MDSETKSKILKSAISVFAHHPYHNATVASICDDAGTNIASVNYHFKSKENLYLEVIRAAFQSANNAYPLTGDLSLDALPAEKLRAFMAAIIKRSFDDGLPGDLNRILSHQARDDSDHQKLVFNEVYRLELNYLDEILAALIEDRSLKTKTIARLNTISLASVFSSVPNAKSLLEIQKAYPDQIEAIIDKQFSFALNGIQSLNANYSTTTV